MIHTCPKGHLTLSKECRVCNRSDFKRAKVALAEARKEIKELTRQIANLQGAIEAGRAM